MTAPNGAAALAERLVSCGCRHTLDTFTLCRWHVDFLATFYPSLPARTRLTVSLAKAEARAEAAEARLADSLDAAWAAAEAAMPEGWDMGLTWADGEYTAWAACYPERDPEEWITRETFGDTPAAALHALAAKLRERSDG